MVATLWGGIPGDARDHGPGTLPLGRRAPAFASLPAPRVSARRVLPVTLAPVGAAVAAREGMMPHLGRAFLRLPACQEYNAAHAHPPVRIWINVCAS